MIFFILVTSCLRHLPILHSPESHLSESPKKSCTNTSTWPLQGSSRIGTYLGIDSIGLLFFFSDLLLWLPESTHRRQSNRRCKGKNTLPENNNHWLQHNPFFFSPFYSLLPTVDAALRFKALGAYTCSINTSPESGAQPATSTRARSILDSQQRLFTCSAQHQTDVTYLFSLSSPHIYRISKQQGHLSNSM